MTITRKLSPLIGFHGCDRSIAERVLSGSTHLNNSENTYDWLGSGIYFWVESFARALDWAKANRDIEDPYVVGAFLDPGLCLNLTDYGAATQIREAYELFADTCHKAGHPLPENAVHVAGTVLVRKLDCAVINYLHELRYENGESAFDTVYGVFEEGEPLFARSALKEKTHIQIAVRNNDAIRGYFRPREMCQYD